MVRVSPSIHHGPVNCPAIQVEQIIFLSKQTIERSKSMKSIYICTYDRVIKRCCLCLTKIQWEPPSILLSLWGYGHIMEIKRRQDEESKSSSCIILRSLLSLSLLLLLNNTTINMTHNIHKMGNDCTVHRDMRQTGQMQIKRSTHFWLYIIISLYARDIPYIHIIYTYVD